MGHGELGPDWNRPVVVRVPVEPVEAAVEADAVDAMSLAGTVGVRGPLFGVAAQDVGKGPRWRVVVPVRVNCPQMARDSLHSQLWFRARDDARDKAERRELLDAVSRLASERVDEIVVAGTRYRVVRAEEYAGLGVDGIEKPRPTDPEPLTPNWDRAPRDAHIDDGVVLDPDAPVTPSQAAERLALRGLSYTGSRFPADVRRDSRQALRTHPDVMLLPTTFVVARHDGKGWAPSSGLYVSAHQARKALDFLLTWLEPRAEGVIPVSADRDADARTLTAEGGASTAPELAEYAEASDRLRAGRVNELEFQGTVYRIGRTRRLLRWGPDGPEGPRPSDDNSHEPDRLHPDLDEDGNVIHVDYEEDYEEGEDQEAAG